MVDEWFDGSIGSKLAGYLLDGESLMFRVSEAAAVRRLLDEHRSGRRDNHKMLFSLVVLEEWLRANDCAGRNGCAPAPGRRRQSRLAQQPHDTSAMPLEYVLITPARNEAAFIERPSSSMIAQTLLPKRWVIVSDGSTDGTDEIVERYTPGSRLARAGQAAAAPGAQLRGQGDGVQRRLRARASTCRSR